MIDDKKTFWEFAPTYGGDDDGFSDAFIEAFTGDVDKSLARETIQNSIDARLDSEKPITVEFQRIIIDCNELPGKSELKKIFKSCLEYYPYDKKVKSFFTETLKIIDKDSIIVLKISDYNTVGLRGDDYDQKGEWYCLVKAQGTTSKQEEKLGSFGIGKGAPFAASSFRTVFYSTLNEKNENVFQGKARLVSHRDNATIKRGTGSFGLQNQASIRDNNLIPPFFRRTARGTDIFIIGYKGKEDEWQENLIKSVLENFWAAILNRSLIVKVGSKTIDYDTLENDLIRYFGYDNWDSPYYYYSCFTKPTKPFSQKLKMLGDCKLYILLQEKAPKKVAYMRRSRMLIKTRHYRSPKPFIGIFICDDKQGNEILRDLEPPQHNDWEPKRTEYGAKVLNELETWVKDCLKELTTSEDVDSAAVPGLEKYFQLPEDYDYEGNAENYFSGDYSGKEHENETNKEIAQKLDKGKLKVVLRYHEPVINYTKSSSAGEKKRKKTDTGKKSGGSYGAGENEGTIKKLEDIKCIKRSFLLKKLTDECEYLLILKPDEDLVNGEIRLNTSADDTTYPTELLEALDLETSEKYSIGGGKINNVVLYSGQKKKIRIRIKTKNKISLIVS